MSNIKNKENLKEREKEFCLLLNQVIELTEIDTLKKILNQKPTKSKPLSKALKR